MLVRCDAVGRGGVGDGAGDDIIVAVAAARFVGPISLQRIELIASQLVLILSLNCCCC